MGIGLASILVEAGVGLAVEAAKNPEKMDELLKSAGKVAEAASPLAGKAADAGTAAVSQFSGKAGQATSFLQGKAGGVFAQATGAVRNVAESRELNKQLEDARNQVLAGATASLAAQDFLKSYESGATPLKGPGYYALATYKGKLNSDAPGKYADVYVGRSEDMGASIYRHLKGRGSADVYADYKYGKYVHVFAFPDFDLEDDNNETLAAFIMALGAHESYNAAFSDEAASQRIEASLCIPQASYESVVSVLVQALPDVHLVEEELCGNGVMRIHLSSKE